jgi:PAS domain S-box-containing protein
MQTVKLLEDSKMKSEELASQEEEMRQNLEELQTTQEESARRELDMNGILEALNSSYIVIELDISGNIININENAKRLLDIAHNNVEGQNLRSFLTNDELDDFETLWTTVISGETVSKQHKTIRGVNEFVISESYTPVYNDVGDIVKILNIGVEIKDN